MTKMSRGWTYFESSVLVFLPHSRKKPRPIDEFVKRLRLTVYLLASLFTVISNGLC